MGKLYGHHVAGDFDKGIDRVFGHNTSSPHYEDSRLRIAAALHEFEVTRLPNHQMTWICMVTCWQYCVSMRFTVVHSSLHLPIPNLQCQSYL